MLLETISQDMKEALKSGESGKLSALRFLVSEIKKFEIDKYPPSVGGKMTDEDVVYVIKKQVKSRKESIEMFKKGDRKDLVEKEEEELKFLEKYLPETMDPEFLRKEVQAELEILKSSGQDLTNPGRVIGQIMPKFKGRADGAVVAGIIQEILKNN